MDFRWLRRTVPVATLVVAAVLAGLWWGARELKPLHRDLTFGHHAWIRAEVAASQARQHPPEIVVFGDSIVEAAHLPELCGRPALAVGAWGARVGELARLAPDLVAAAKPARIVVAVGVNDAARRDPTDPDAFVAAYRALIAPWRASGLAVDLATLAPVVEAAPLGDVNFDPARMRRLDERIRALAAEQGAGLIPLDTLPQTATGGLRPDLSDDGVHLTPEGYRLWRETIETAICPPKP